MRLIRALAPSLQVRGRGSIINVGSPVGVVGARKPQYAASKAALHGLTMSCARAMGKDGVRVNLLLPGPTITRMTQDWSVQQRENVARGSALQRLCLPEEVAATIAFLLGDDSSYITASVVDMTAGSMLGH
jgi:Dehydrogenases with different specificities (related to short-chain alcohol dehydrogenases)